MPPRKGRGGHKKGPTKKISEPVIDEEQTRVEKSDEEEDLDALWNEGTTGDMAARVNPYSSASSSEDSYFGATNNDGQEESSSERSVSESSDVEQEDAIAEERPGTLPAATAVFDNVKGPPSFLNPEANRPITAPINQSMGEGPSTERDGQPLNKRGQPRGEWDVSKMAPKLKSADAEAAAAGGVIRASAVQYRKTESAMAGPSAATIAMLGGGDVTDKGKPTKAMGVSEFLDKGPGGAQLPRKRQDRKEKERDKRMRGQSSHAAWKSEAEMVLRQQYD